MIKGDGFMKKFLSLCLFIFMLLPYTAVTAQAQFDDVGPGNVHSEGIQSLIEKEVINGYPTETGGRIFKPNAKLTRAHAAVIFSRYFNYSKGEQDLTVLDQYNDVDDSHPYAAEIAYVTEQEIFKGSNGEFQPEKPLRRDQMATVISNAFNLDQYKRDVAVNVNIDNVTVSHKAGVELLAQHNLTTELKDFRPGEDITRGQFSSFLHRVEQRELIEENTTPTPPASGGNTGGTTPPALSYDINGGTATITSVDTFIDALTNDDVEKLKVESSMNLTGVSAIDKPIEVINEALTINFDGANIASLTIIGDEAVGSDTTIQNAVIDAIVIEINVDYVTFNNVTDSEGSEHTFNGGGSESIVFNGNTVIKGNINVTATEDIQIRSESAEAKIDGTVTIDSEQKVNINVPTKSVVLSENTTDVEINQPVEDLLVSKTTTKITVTNRENIPATIKRRPSSDTTAPEKVTITVKNEDQSEESVEVDTEVSFDFSMLDFYITQAKQILNTITIGDAVGEYQEVLVTEYESTITEYVSFKTELAQANTEVTVAKQQQIDEKSIALKSVINDFRRSFNRYDLNEYKTLIATLTERLTLVDDEVKVANEAVIADLSNKLEDLKDQLANLTRDEISYSINEVRNKVEWLENGAPDIPFAGEFYTIDLSKDYIDAIGVADVHLFNAKGHALADDLHYDFKIEELDNHYRLTISNIDVTTDQFYLVIKKDYFIVQEFTQETPTKITPDLASYVSVPDVVFPNGEAAEYISVEQVLNEDSGFSIAHQSDALYVKPGSFNIIYEQESEPEVFFTYVMGETNVSVTSPDVTLKATDFQQINVTTELSSSVNINDVHLQFEQVKSYQGETMIIDSRRKLLDKQSMKQLNYLNASSDKLILQYELERQGVYETIRVKEDYRNADELLLTNTFEIIEQNGSAEDNFDADAPLSDVLSNMQLINQLNYVEDNPFSPLAFDLTFEVDGQAQTVSATNGELYGMTIQDLVGEVAKGSEIVITVDYQSPVLDVTRFVKTIEIGKKVYDLTTYNAYEYNLNQLLNKMVIGDGFGQFSGETYNALQNAIKSFSEEKEAILNLPVTEESTSRLNALESDMLAADNQYRYAFNLYNLANLEGDLADYQSRLDQLNPDTKETYAEVITSLQETIDTLPTEVQTKSALDIYRVMRQLDFKVQALEHGLIETPFSGDAIEVMMPRSLYENTRLSELIMVASVHDWQGEQGMPEIVVSDDYIHFFLNIQNEARNLYLQVEDKLQAINPTDDRTIIMHENWEMYDLPKANWPEGIQTKQVFVQLQEDIFMDFHGVSKNRKLNEGTYYLNYLGEDEVGNLYTYSYGPLLINQNDLETDALSLSDFNAYTLLFDQNMSYPVQLTLSGETEETVFYQSFAVNQPIDTIFSHRDESISLLSQHFSDINAFDISQMLIEYNGETIQLSNQELALTISDDTRDRFVQSEISISELVNQLRITNNLNQKGSFYNLSNVHVTIKEGEKEATFTAPTWMDTDADFTLADYLVEYDFNQPTSISFSIDYSKYEVAPYVINLAE